MIKKDIVVKNLDGVEVTKTYYFSIPPTEMFRMNEEMGGLEKSIKAIIGEQDIAKIMVLMEKLIEKSVGVRVEDDFERLEGDALRRFMNSEAFSVLVMEFLTDTKAFAEWCAGILPADLAKKLKDSGALELPEAPKPKVFPNDYSKDELEMMPKDEFQRHLASLPGNNIPRELLLLAMRKS